MKNPSVYRGGVFPMLRIIRNLSGVCTVTDFDHDSHSKWQKSVTIAFSYGMIGSENTWVCTVTHVTYYHHHFTEKKCTLCTKCCIIPL